MGASGRVRPLPGLAEGPDVGGAEDAVVPPTTAPPSITSSWPWMCARPSPAVPAADAGQGGVVLDAQVAADLGRVATAGVRHRGYRVVAVAGACAWAMPSDTDAPPRALWRPRP